MCVSRIQLTLQAQWWRENSVTGRHHLTMLVHRPAGLHTVSGVKKFRPLKKDVPNEGLIGEWKTVYSEPVDSRTSEVAITGTQFKLRKINYRSRLPALKDGWLAEILHSMYGMSWLKGIDQERRTNDARRNTVKSIVNKYRKRGASATLQRTGRPSKTERRTR